MADAFNSVWLKIKRAKKHTDDLETEIIRFWSTKPYEIETQGNPKTGPGCYRIKGVPKPIPESVPLIVGDAAHNLRTALDHFACGAVATVTDGTAFPVWRKSRTPTAAEWGGLVQGKLQGARPGLIRAVSAVEAYQAGNGEYVWTANELDRIDKHRLLIALAGTNSAVIIDLGEQANTAKDRAAGLPPWPSMPIALKPQWTPIEAGTELYITRAGRGHEAEPKFTFDIAFGEPLILKGKPVVPALRGLIDEVESLLKRLVPLA